MAVYLESYLSFSISIQVANYTRHAGSFSCKASIDSADGEGAMSMISSERFPSEAHAKTFGLDWAKAWIDKTTASGKS